jgi:hypothetical protein
VRRARRDGHAPILPPGRPSTPGEAGGSRSGRVVGGVARLVRWPRTFTGPARPDAPRRVASGCRPGVVPRAGGAGVATGDHGLRRRAARLRSWSIELQGDPNSLGAPLTMESPCWRAVPGVDRALAHVWVTRSPSSTPVRDGAGLGSLPNIVVALAAVPGLAARPLRTSPLRWGATRLAVVPLRLPEVSTHPHLCGSPRAGALDSRHHRQKWDMGCRGAAHVPIPSIIDSVGQKRGVARDHSKTRGIRQDGLVEVRRAGKSGTAARATT